MRNNTGHHSDVIQIHPSFRMILLANRPGYPFQGNDFFSEFGDMFSCHVVENPTGESELHMLKSYGPNVPDTLIMSLTNVFDELRLAVEQGFIQYPYSTRELVNIVKHLDKYGGTDSIHDALNNVIAFDQFNEKTMNHLESIFEKFGIPLMKGM
jgi:hypothetical protein